MVLRLYKLPRRSGSNVPTACLLGFLLGLDLLGRCYFSCRGTPLKGGCRVKGRRSETKKIKKPPQWFFLPRHTDKI